MPTPVLEHALVASLGLERVRSTSHEDNVDSPVGGSGGACAFLGWALVALTARSSKKQN